MKTSVMGLFPTPFMTCEGAIDAALVERLRARAVSAWKQSNVRTDLLSHTEMIDPKDDADFTRVGEIINARLVEFGELLFGEKLQWTVKETWLNVLQKNGSQFLHSHANSFISGVIYLTEQHASARTMFAKSMGGTEFVFKNDGNSAKIGPYNGEKWMVPAAKPGDMILYPSYLLHGVAPNQGGERVSLALNAIPNKLKSYGYEIGFSR
ncbi:MAG: putative 2OG-Fe(II) oxygenase [Pseudomonadota bacterium]